MVRVLRTQDVAVACFAESGLCNLGRGALFGCFGGMNVEALRIFGKIRCWAWRDGT